MCDAQELERFDHEQRVVRSGHPHMGPGGEIRPGHQPYRIVDLEPPAAVDDGTVEREDSADIALAAPVEAASIRGGRAEAKAIRPRTTLATASAAKISA